MCNQINRKNRNKWQDNIDQRFAGFRYGKYSTRQSERRTLHNVVNDIISLNIAANRFNQLNQADLGKLVKYWQSKGNTEQTVYKKLCIINKHYPTQVLKPFIVYKAVKEEIANRKKPILSIVSLSDIENTPLRFLYSGQQLFGLTFKEVLNLKPSLLCENTIKVLRLYAFNGRERHINIRTQEQQAWISYFCQIFSSVYLPCSHLSLTRLHRRYCQSLSIPGEYFRYQYLFNRYYELLNQYQRIDQKIKRCVLRQLRVELGYYDNAPIREKITCLSEYCEMPPTVCAN